MLSPISLLSPLTSNNLFLSGAVFCPTETGLERSGSALQLFHTTHGMLLTSPSVQSARVFTPLQHTSQIVSARWTVKRPNASRRPSASVDPSVLPTNDARCRKCGGGGAEKLCAMGNFGMRKGGGGRTFSTSLWCLLGESLTSHVADGRLMPGASNSKTE